MFDEIDAETTKYVFSRDEVRSGIHILADCSVFSMFRDAAQSNKGVFSKAEPNSTTKQVLENWVGALNSGDQSATKLMWNDQEKIQKVLSLTQDGLAQQILIAYWEVTLDTPWGQTKNHINDKQLHLVQKGFPTQEFCEQVYTAISH